MLAGFRFVPVSSSFGGAPVNRHEQNDWLQGAPVAGTDPEQCPAPPQLELKKIITVFSELNL